MLKGVFGHRRQLPFLLMLQDPPAPASKAPKTVGKTSAQAAAALRQRVLSNSNSSDMRVLPRAFEVRTGSHICCSVASNAGRQHELLLTRDLGSC